MQFNTTSLESLQSDEQRRVLDAIAQMRKCGLEDVLSIPQIVVCGDQSAGKSSVLEAITEIPFPRNDNLCTRFATEIILRRAEVESITIKVIPDITRTEKDKESIRAFQASITNFEELPKIMDKAMSVMGIDEDGHAGQAFSRDTLSVEIEGPSRPQLILVDLPGLIQNESKGVTATDIALVAEITDRYISQPRTVCLAVISATNDYANQGILSKVRNVDPQGDRTLGIITKPDRLPAGSGSESAFIGLALNHDISLGLGWHVLKNRSYEERSYSFTERKASEALFFANSNWSHLPKDCIGVESLVERLSALLFEHVKRQLPDVQADVSNKFSETQEQLKIMGKRRATPQECRDYLMQLSLDVFLVCKAAVDGHYEGDYFNRGMDQAFHASSPSDLHRLRAMVQSVNAKFTTTIRTKGHTYYFAKPGEEDSIDPSLAALQLAATTFPTKSPKVLQRSQAIAWVGRVLTQNRGRELQGNFNPLIVGELFWQQSSKWEHLAAEHVKEVAAMCSNFLHKLLLEKYPKHIYSRLWTSHIQAALETKYKAAERELKLIIEDQKSYPINYNHYYTDTMSKYRKEREGKALAQCVKAAIIRRRVADCTSDHISTTVNIDKAVKEFTRMTDPDMEKRSCEEALDCLVTIYKVSQKTFIANVTTQVIERHLLRGLEKIFSPVVVNALSDQAVTAIAAEPGAAKRQRAFLEDRIAKLEDGRRILSGLERLSL
ncbi:uncharacterized protein K452DRAFT_353894 [Aplosporella prunicola CBS 121167]|uniref:GED domain-containing protein n=1 Tax=Aplosporella prunicola CBS 121167 TaxID=1176127 RepID=A0A6A6AZ41_9PEZI|nr:uncharacterized protein K452DRAFT_353894 [Aplosporella prunicola CBS 121167]KAF2136538.1 hypothetical protein K452DRAFT_353894 [Aplosporella prunicola CBS 121167]